MTSDDARRRDLETDRPGLAPTATTKERIQTLLSLGLTAADLCKAVRVTEATIRNWTEETTVPREPALRALDDLRAAVVGLVASGLDNASAVSWLTSRNTGEWLAGHRPIELLRTDPVLVLAAVEDLLMAHPAEQELRSESDRLVTLRGVRPKASPGNGAAPTEDSIREAATSSRRRRRPAPAAH